MDQIVPYFTRYFNNIFPQVIQSEIKDRISRLNKAQLKDLRSKLFSEAFILDSKQRGSESLIWLQKCFELIDVCIVDIHQVYFSPGTEILDSIADLLNRALYSLDLCVFTITDDRLANDLIACQRRGIRIRLITNDDKIYDQGSVIQDLQDAGIPVKIDHSQYHMHHNFGIIDSLIVFTGSFNWTYTASKHNQENLLITSDANIQEQYLMRFEQLWQEMYYLQKMETPLNNS